MHVAAKPTPNPSLKRSANGRSPGPVWRYAVHFRQPAPGVLPSSPAEAQRSAGVLKMQLLNKQMVSGPTAILNVFSVVLALAVTSTSHAITFTQDQADTLVQQLRDLPTPLPNSGNGITTIPTSAVPLQQEEQRRHQLYGQIRSLGKKGVLALSRGLHDQDVQLRKNVALAFSVLAGGWFDSAWPKLDIKAGLPALIAALQDSDGSVRGWSAQAIGEIGPDAAPAVPELIRLLSNPDEGSRNSACIAFRGIGPTAKEALPALQKSLSDPSKDVRQFAM